jgi:LysM repeat protein
MGSLTAHLLETGDHGRLGFHPSCPVCRQERLRSKLSSGPVISRRVRAALASCLLAISTASPAAAPAQEPDRQQEGIMAPEPAPTDVPGQVGPPQQPGRDQVDVPGFDPGGETVQPLEAAPPPTAAPTGGGDEDTGEGAPVDAEPVDDPDAREALPTTPEAPPPSAEGGPPSTPTEVAPAPSVPPAQDPPALEPPPAAVEPPAVPEVPDTEPKSERSPDRKGSHQAGEREPVSESERNGFAPSREAAPMAPWEPPASAVPPNSQISPAPVPAAPAAEPIVPVQVSAPAQSSEEPLSSNDRTYMVRSGDSLWSIARRLLGADATPAQIAREVNRLWELNKDQIGTGDPDLLNVGTALNLR